MHWLLSIYLVLNVGGTSQEVKMTETYKTKKECVEIALAAFQGLKDDVSHITCVQQNDAPASVK